MIVGIDLGTTNSAVAIWKDGRPELVPNAIGDHLTPSAVSISDSGTLLVGAAALDRRTTHPKLTATNFKRLIGTQQQTRLGNTSLSPEELSAIVLQSLKQDVESVTGEPVTGAVVTVPAYFNDRQRKATRRAGEIAGLKVERLINEPTAAALAFGLHDRQEREPFLVFDLGGGTFDVSIVEMFEGIIEVRASAGDNRLGGEDFNDCLIEMGRARLDLTELDILDLEVEDALLRNSAEHVRRRLSEADHADFVVTHGNKTLTTSIVASDFEEHCAALIQRLRDPVLRSLRDSDIHVETLSEIVLVGGATRMPVVRRAITRMFGRFPSSAVHPDHAVALGAAVQAGLLTRDAALDEIRLTDVCPFTLGVENSEYDARGKLRDGLFSPIIDRNTAIPASRVGYYRTVSDGQKEIRLRIYQGESREVNSNVKLGELRVPVPPRPAGEVHIDCRFTYDSSGLLEVDVSVPATGTTRNLAIFDDADGMSPKELEHRRAELAKLKFHPREDARNSALLARATRNYEAFLGERRDQIGHWITAFESALDTQDPRVIHEAQAMLAQHLDMLERERFL